MARPSKNNEHKLGAIVHVRVTLAEKQQLKTQAAETGLSLSDWMRMKVMGVKPLARKPGPDREVLLRLLAAFGKTGSNINQIARQLNRKNEDFEIPASVIVHALRELNNLMQRLRETLDHAAERKDTR